MSTTAVHELCEVRSISIADLAARAGIPAEIVVAFAEGRTGLPAQHRSELAEALNVLPEHLDGPARFDLLDDTKNDVRDQIHYGLGELAGYLRLEMPGGEALWYPVAGGAFMDLDAIDESVVAFSTITLNNRLLVLRNGAMGMDLVTPGELPDGVVPPRAFPIAHAAELPEYLSSGGFRATDLSLRQQGAVVDLVSSLPPGTDAWEAFLGSRVHLRDGSVRTVDVEPSCLVAIAAASNDYRMEDPLELRNTRDEIELTLSAHDVVLIDAPLCDYLQEAMDAVLPF